LAVCDTLKVKCATDDVVTNTWKVWHTSTTNEHNSVFLKVVAFAADVCPYFLTISKANTGNFT
jgi:hypothetical protein